MPIKSKSFSSSTAETVAGTGEDLLVRRLTRGLPQSSRTLTGPGDDCAVIGGCRKMELTLFKADAIIQDIHFTMDADAARIGWKALCRAISDIAAMGGEPQEALITLALPRQTLTSWVERLYLGIRRAARRYGCGIAGGETSSVPDGAPVMISVAMLGTVERRSLCLRSGGRAGDVICVTGRLGGSLRGRHLDFTPRLAEARWLVKEARPTAMMDLSDGLASDLPRLAAASGTGFRIDQTLLPRQPGCSPEQAMGDGEDYELLLTLPANRLARVQRAWCQVFPRVPLTCIGALTGDTRERTLPGWGWDHFRQ